MEKGGRRFIIDLHTQMIGEEAASSDSEGEGESGDEGKKRMEPNEEGVLRLEGGTTDDDLDSVNGLLHWQMEDYEVFPSCNVLGIEEKNAGNEFPNEYFELKEGEVKVDETPGHTFSEEKPMKYEEPTVKTMNLGDEENLKNILVGHDWSPVLKTTAFRIFTKYKDVFAWTYKDLKGVPPELCVPRIPVRKRPYRMNKNYAAWATKVLQNRQKAWHDKHLKSNRFQSGLVLKHNGRNKIRPSRFKRKWVGPYKIHEVGDNRAVKLSTLDGKEVAANAINGSKLKVYHERNNAPLWTNN